MSENICLFVLKYVTLQREIKFDAQNNTVAFNLE
jgi:hypothetical protein